MTSEFNAAAIRDQFSILKTEIHGKKLVYLDSAASAQKPQMVLDSLHSAYSETYANVHRGLHYLSEASTDAYEAVRGKVAKFIHAKDEKEVVFTSGATMSLNRSPIAMAIRHLKAGDEVLITVAEHHANIVPWHCWASGWDRSPSQPRPGWQL